MSKAIKTFIILNLLASIALIVLGTMLFLEKELIKARPLMMRDTLNQIASNLKWGEVVADFELTDNRFTGSYILPEPVRHQDLPRLETQVGHLSSFASGRVGHLGAVHRNLVQTQNILDTTKETLATRERELREAEAEVARLEGEIDRTRTQLAQARSQITTLRGEVTGLQTRLDTLNTDLVDRNNQISTLEIDLEAAIEERNLLVEEYKACRLGASNGEQDSGEWRGKTARILEINPNWEYVVIDKGLADKLTGDIEAYVHRGKDYVGKLHITKVDRLVSVARILPGSVPEGVELKPGDTLFF